VADGFPNQIAGWVPGATPAVLPYDLSIRVNADAIIVMQVHYSSCDDVLEECGVAVE